MVALSAARCDETLKQMERSGGARSPEPKVLCFRAEMEMTGARMQESTEDCAKEEWLA